jgi:restriction endonuclease S subunit
VGGVGVGGGGGLRANPNWAKLPLFNRKGWKRLPFGAFLDSINERVEPADAAEEIYVGLDDLDSGDLHIRRWGKGSDVIGTKLRFRNGDVIFGRRRAYQRKLAVAEVDGICSAHAMVVRAKSDVVLPEFLPFLMMSDRFMKRAVKISVGSLSPTINWKTLKLEEFDLPPLDQQRRIAEILWAVDAELDSLLQVRTAVEGFRKSFFGENLAVFETKPLSEVAEFLDGKRVPLSEKERAKRKGPYPYYGASGVIDSVDDFLFDEPLVLLSEDGFNLVNRTSRIAFKAEGKVWVNNHAHVLRPKPSVNIDFLADYLEAISLEPYITGTYQRKLNKSECERIPIPVPPPAVQDDIAATIARTVTAISAIDNHVATSKSLASSLLTHISEDCR